MHQEANALVGELEGYFDDFGGLEVRVEEALMGGAILISLLVRTVNRGLVQGNRKPQLLSATERASLPFSLLQRRKFEPG